MHLSLIGPENPMLNNPSQEIIISDLQNGKWDELIDAMFAFARGEQTDQAKKIMVGLSAVQVGYPVNIILIDLAANGRGVTGNLEEFINPVIESQSEETNEWYEACFSAGTLAGIVQSPNQIELAAYKRDGTFVRKKLSGYSARIGRHEVDHTLGKRFPDLIKDQENLHIVEPGDWPEYRNSEAWRSWPKKAPPDAWKNIKDGKNV